MAYTIRNLITDAYKESGVLGIGMTLSSVQLQDGLGSLNLILDGVYAGNEGGTSTSTPVTFTGASNYTVGPQPANPILNPELVPDIELPIMPSKISGIVITVNGVRIPTTGISPDVYFSRSLNSISNAAPSNYFFERTFPLGTIRFYEGTPSGPGEIIYNPSLVDATANTDFKYYPRELKPYLIYSLAADIAESNSFDNTSLMAKSNKAWNNYKTASYEGQSYHCDGSAPRGSVGGKYNIYAGD